MSAKYFEYYTIILRGAVFSWTHCRCTTLLLDYYCKENAFVKKVIQQKQLVNYSRNVELE